MHSHFAISEWSHVYSPIWQLTEASKGLSVELSSVRLRGATGTGEIINPTGFELLRELEQRIPCNYQVTTPRIWDNHYKEKCIFKKVIG